MAEHGSEKERTSKRQERIEACAKMQCPWANGRPILVFFVEGLRTADCCVLCPLVLGLSARCCGPCRCDRYPWPLNRRVSVFGTLRTCRQNIHSNQVAAFDAGDIQCIVGHGAVPFGQAQQPGIAGYADGVDSLRFLLGLFLGGRLKFIARARNACAVEACLFCTSHRRPHSSQ